ncbi:hypothetical protein FB45DRAFT_759109 [Roridomyces roridus]|uniref:T6SS Phospholipase effector Tle1-like catalytic domain-containing protein n=1 Tax=Roridomyces roridus TaxID=1738132 RepID=A0AAD7B8S5_9AGAR|nr:hypothetical protein FB45DRAFT_759109 [Roridomyces roridus]
MREEDPQVDGSRFRALEETVSRLEARLHELEHTRKHTDDAEETPPTQGLNDTPIAQKCLCSASGQPSGRRLIVALDGTENKFGAQSSHVVEFYSRIMKSENQPSYYTSGIGTYAKKSGPIKRISAFVKNKWASVTAWNFKSNLLAGYQWLSENYQPGDQIFLLGYSRGAYQARVLAAMIAKVGLIRTGNKEQIPFAFEIYRDAKSSIEVHVLPQVSQFKKAFCRNVHIHFVGVWDTVSSVGLFSRKVYPGAQSADNICFVRHALALDERRVKFLPEYVTAPRSSFERGEFGAPRCKEVWFRGCHSDVGGGKQTNFTSDNGAVPSRWMAYEAMLAGLDMLPFKRNVGTQDLTGRPPSNSMTVFYKIFEYFPFLAWADPALSPLEPYPGPRFLRCATL